MKYKTKKFFIFFILMFMFIFYDMSHFIKADNEIVDLQSAGNTVYVYGDGEYSKQITLYAYNYETENILNLKDYLYYPSNFDTVNDYIKDINDTYKSVTFSLYGSLKDLLFEFNIINKTSKDIDILIDIYFDEIYIPLNFGGAEDYFSSVPGNFLQTQYSLKYVVPSNSSINRQYKISETWFNGYNTQYSLSNNYQFPDIFNRNFVVRLPIKFSVNSNANKNDFELKFSFISNQENSAKLLSLSNGKFIIPFPPIDMPDWRTLVSLKNIWSAINGQSSSNNLVDTINNSTTQQTNSLTNGYDNTSLNQSNTNLQNSFKQLDDAEAMSGQALNTLNNFNGFDETALDEALASMQFISQATDNVISSNSLIHSLIIGAFLFFIASVIIGVRRYI